MIARAGRLAQDGSSTRLQRGQNERALELGAGDLQLVLDADERAAAHAQRRVDVARARRIAAPFDRRAHLAQRRRHPPHRPPGERGIAPHLGLERPPGQKAQQKADRRPRVAAVERLGGLVQPGEPDARRCAPDRPRAGRRRPAPAALPPSTGCRPPARDRSPRRPRRRARRRGARGGRSTCHQGPGRCRAAAPSGAREARTTSPD